MPQTAKKPALCCNNPHLTKGKYLDIYILLYLWKDVQGTRNFWVVFCFSKYPFLMGSRTLWREAQGTKSFCIPLASPWALASCCAAVPAYATFPSDFPFCCSPLLSFLFPTARPCSHSPLLYFSEKFAEWPNLVSVFPIVIPFPSSQCHSLKGTPCHIPSRSKLRLLICFLELELRPHLDLFVSSLLGLLWLLQFY